MKYTVNLYKADDKGFLVARACMKSALQLGGNNTRDTRLLSSEMPQWNYSPLYAPVPLDEYFYTKLRARDIKQTMPDLHNPEVARAINENELDLKVMRGILATDEKSYGGLFLQYLMSYPRWVNAKGEIEVGGEDYFAILEESADAERKAINNVKPLRMADASHIATISDRAHKRMESLAAVPPEQLHEVFAKQERLKRGGIDEATTAFLDFVNIAGHKTGCNTAAGVVTGAIKRLLELLDTCNREDFNKLDAACNAAEDALLSFGLALAERQDAEATAKINGEGKSTDKETTPDLLKDLMPESKRGDAIQYCARLVCYVWNTGEHGGKRKSNNYVFVKAKEGENLFGDCRYARTLVTKWGISTGGIMTNAATMHAAQSGGKHMKADGMERPETMREAARKSRAAERAEREQKAEHGTRRSGKKR